MCVLVEHTEAESSRLYRFQRSYFPAAVHKRTLFMEFPIMLYKGTTLHKLEFEVNYYNSIILVWRKNWQDEINMWNFVSTQLWINAE